MSKGSPIVSVRFTAVDLFLMDQAIQRVNAKRRKEPHTRSSFIWQCVMDKVAHLERGRNSSRERTRRRREDRQLQGQENAENLSAELREGDFQGNALAGG